jgi:hypothetical protein
MEEVEVERYCNDLGLCSLLNDPWRQAKEPESKIEAPEVA